MAARTEKVDFLNARGERLSARLDRPEDAPLAYALFAHCFTCSKEIFAASRIAAALAAHGYAVLRFDFTGLGSSEGEFANTNFSSNVDDIVAAAAHLRATVAAPRLLVGHSLGGAAVLAAAKRIPEAVAVATINAPAEPTHVRALLGGAAGTIERAGEAAVQLGKRTFKIRRQFLSDIASYNMQEALRNLGRALIVFHAPHDEIVGIDNARRIFDAARHPKSFVSLDDADHLLSRREDAAYVADILAAWAARYLHTEQKETVLAPPPPEGWVRVSETGEGPFAEEVLAGRHRLQADEPERAGGTDSGPSPYDLLLAALGTCTAMTLRLYAERKQWAVGRISVELRHDRIHAQDCADCEAKEGQIDRLERVISVDGRLDDEQRARLLEIADKCPVHRTLKGEKVIATRFASDPPAALARQS
jgi:putative redox protein